LYKPKRTAMNVITSVEKWGNSHRPSFLDIFRIALGIYITYKGLHFITHMNELKMTAQGVTQWFAGAVIAHYVIFAHILAGPLIVFGLFTRIACLIQLPILLAAVIFVNYPKGFLSIGNHMELELSLVVLAGLIVFMIFGAGRYSIDAKRRRELEITH
jgi:putative oxidoreductase